LEFLCKYELLISYLRATYMLDLIYAVPFLKISGRLSHVSQILLIKQTVVVKMEILIWSYCSLLGNKCAPKKFRYESSLTRNSTIYTSIYLLTIISFALCSDHTIFIFLINSKFFAYSFTNMSNQSVLYYHKAVILVSI
jgi:hypothetical protein